MKLTQTINGFTVETTIASDPFLGLAKGCVYSLTKAFDPVEFEINNRGLKDEPLKPVVELRMPPVLTGSRIGLALQQAEVARQQCDQLVTAVQYIEGGDLSLLTEGMIAQGKWDAAAQMLALASHVPGAVNAGVASKVFMQTSNALHEGELYSLTRLLSGVGKHFLTQLQSLSLLASESAIKQCDGFVQLRNKALDRIQAEDRPG